MKTLLNPAFSLLLGTAMLISSPINACAAEGQSMPTVASAIARVGAQIASDLKLELNRALAAPEPVRTRRAPSVKVEEVSGAADEMYVVVVEASRLPALDAATAQARL